jgi:hypothetical protein
MVAGLSLLPDLPVRTISVGRTADVADIEGDYDLIECFCNEADCDCRRVMIAVISRATNKAVAHISYGWESVDFYLKWTKGDLSQAIDCQGPYLDPLNPQSANSNIFLMLFEKFVMQDKAYMERLKQHYSLFKAALKRKNRPLSLVTTNHCKPKKRRRK